MEFIILFSIAPLDLDNVRTKSTAPIDNSFVK